MSVTLPAVILRGTFAARPAAGSAGRLYFASDTGKQYRDNGVSWDEVTPPAGGSGTVTSVALTVPAEFSVAGSPVTTAGTLAVSKATQSANAVYAGPTTGSAAAPTFRAVVPADLPLASSSAFGAVKVDGTTITAAGGVISAAAGGSAGALVLLEQHTASSSASLDFTTAISSAYDTYQIEFISIIPGTNNVDFLTRVNTGSGFISSAAYSHLSWRNISNSQAAGGDTSGTATGINLAIVADHIGNSANWGVCGSCRLYTYPSSVTRIIGQVNFITGGFLFEQATVSGVYGTTTAITQIQFLMSSGNIASGTIRIYGIAKS